MDQVNFEVRRRSNVAQPNSPSDCEECQRGWGTSPSRLFKARPLAFEITRPAHDIERTDQIGGVCSANENASGSRSSDLLIETKLYVVAYMLDPEISWTNRTRLEENRGGSSRKAEIKVYDAEQVGINEARGGMGCMNRSKEATQKG